MKIAVFGATGGVGREVLQQALAAGHQVTAQARNPGRLDVDDPNLSVIAGNVLDIEAVRQTLQDADAAVISLGNTANNPEHVVSEGTQVILDAIAALGGPRRIVVVSSLGVGESKDQVPFAFKMLMKTALRKPMEDKERQEALVKASGLDWTIVRPGGLTNGPATGQYRSGLDPKISAGQVARADVAAFVLQQLTDDTYLHKAPAIT